MITVSALDLATGEGYEDADSRIFEDAQYSAALAYVAQLRRKRRKGSTIIHGIRRNSPPVNPQ